MNLDSTALYSSAHVRHSLFIKSETAKPSYSLPRLTRYDRLNLCQTHINITEEGVKNATCGDYIPEYYNQGLPEGTLKSKQTIENLYPWLFVMDTQERAKKSLQFSRDFSDAKFFYSPDCPPKKLYSIFLFIGIRQGYVTRSALLNKNFLSPVLDHDAPAILLEINGAGFAATRPPNSLAVLDNLTLESIKTDTSAAVMLSLRTFFKRVLLEVAKINDSLSWTRLPEERRIPFLQYRGVDKLPKYCYMSTKAANRSVLRMLGDVIRLKYGEGSREEEALKKIRPQIGAIIVAALQSSFDERTVEVVTDSQKAEKIFKEVGESCMGYEINNYAIQRVTGVKSSPISLYFTNPDFALLTAFENGLPVARAVADKGVKRYGRVYGNKEAMRAAVAKALPGWCQLKGLSPILGMEFSAKIIEANGVPCFISPYVDEYTVSRGAAGVGWSKEDSDGYVRVRFGRRQDDYPGSWRHSTTSECHETGGICIDGDQEEFKNILEEYDEEGGDEVYSAWHNRYLTTDEAVWVPSASSWVRNSDTVFDAYMSSYILAEDAKISAQTGSPGHVEDMCYVEATGGWYHNSEVFYCTVLDAAFPQEDARVAYSEYHEESLWTEDERIVRPENVDDLFVLEDLGYPLEIGDTIEYAPVMAWDFPRSGSLYKRSEGAPNYFNIEYFLSRHICNDIEDANQKAMAAQVSGYDKNYSFQPYVEDGNGSAYEIAGVLDEQTNVNLSEVYENWIQNSCVVFVDHPCIKEFILVEELEHLLEKFPTLDNEIYALNDNGGKVQVDPDFNTIHTSTFYLQK